MLLIVATVVRTRHWRQSRGWFGGPIFAETSRITLLPMKPASAIRLLIKSLLVSLTLSLFLKTLGIV
jgi:hypothetical protein